ncbi:MAG: sensor histidine kinase [Parabacteroides sp.]
MEDDGFGISPAEQRKVFEKFYRSPRLSGKQIPGLGLGLSYVRQIVEAHHGRVSSSKQNRGGNESYCDITSIRIQNVFIYIIIYGNTSENFTGG